jgi:glyoxylase-like metal-dependent hydrolase (beta-lactamase superfamily II)
VATTAGTVMIDPLPVAAKALERLGRIEAICLSVQSHQRSSWKLRKQLGVRVYAPRAADGLEESPDHWYSEGDPLPGGLRAIHAPGPCEASYVFYSRETSARFRFVSDEYMDDPAAARASVEKILARSDLSYDVLCSAHGNPLKGGAVDAIRRALPRQ